MARRLLMGLSSALVLGCGLTACAPTQTLSIAPISSEPGRTSNLVSHSDSVYVRLQFVRADARELVFEAEFSNAANHPVTIDPARFYYFPQPDSTARHGEGAPAAPTLTADRRLALNPEVRLDSLAHRRDELADKASRVNLVQILLLVANTAEDVASANQRETPLQRTSRQVRHEGSQAFFEVQRVVRAVRAEQLNQTVSDLAVSTLQRATLQPGDRAVGLVYFPRLDAARQLTFVLAFDEQSVPFSFTQQLRKLNGK
ncbi:hypothetical protein [Hymenobacter psychrophilus]|uniref:Uncharacterized protein n=1 Tax=Hymenobacter psychrophilus TaxID=651662 RepID=A0A1H3BER9_9BACT|nr:hypothetical protein [Hymenobacter psychrophilus]SDX39559.1 hypothetical protein SAMN04488069_101240 [Hymenobacter psychrophilus]